MPLSPGRTLGRSVFVVSTLSMVVACAPAYASDVIIDGLHCNDLCQSWLGYRGPVTPAPLTAARIRPEHGTSPHREAAASAPVARPHRLKVEPHRPDVQEARSERVAPADRGIRPKRSEVASARQAPHPHREARTVAPLPAPRSAHPARPADSTAVETIAPTPATPPSSDPPRRVK